MPHRSLSLELLRRLVALDTTSAHSNLELMAWVRDYLDQHGVASELVYNDDRSKANLFATIGPQDRAGVMLSGHTDTVPVIGQNWTKPPYSLTEENGRLYGRGTTDMKGFIAVVLAAVPRMLEAGLQIPVHLALSYDEEVGCLGVRRLIDSLRRHPVRPAVCIVGEPTGMQVATRHKGKLAARVTVHGHACHSGLAPRGVNAVNHAARLIGWLEREALERQARGPFEQGHEIPFSTIHTGRIDGGTALNIVPDRCSFEFEMRNVAAEDPRQLLGRLRDQVDEQVEEMRRTAPACAIDIEVITEYPGLDTADDSGLVSFVRTLTALETPARIGFGTEGGLFSQQLKIPTVVCGPGDMVQGHKPDEFIAFEQIEQCESFIERLIVSLATDNPITGGQPPLRP